jgi:enoyl-[acyl-carrier protein] reductase I
MIDLQGKVALILGVANQHSISYGIAQALRACDAELGLTYRREGRERHVAPLAAQLGARLLARCDARDDAQLADLIEQVRATFGRLDILVHAAVGANPEDLRGAYLGTTRASFLDALDASVYSLVGLVKAAEKLLQPGASVLTLSYHGARQVVPHYNVMGVAKAALEASVRYLAADLGPRGVRVNAISAGPLRTLSASGIAGFRSMHRRVGKRTLRMCSSTSTSSGALADEQGIWRLLVARFEAILGERLRDACVVDIACGEGYLSPPSRATAHARWSASIFLRPRSPPLRAATHRTCRTGSMMLRSCALCCRGDAPAPELASEPVADLAPAVLHPAADIARYCAIRQNRLRDTGWIGADPGPMRCERPPVTRGKGRHLGRHGVELLLEQNRQVGVAHCPQRNAG